MEYFICQKGRYIFQLDKISTLSLNTNISGNVNKTYYHCKYFLPSCCACNEIIVTLTNAMCLKIHSSPSDDDGCISLALISFTCNNWCENCKPTAAYVRLMTVVITVRKILSLVKWNCLFSLCKNISLHRLCIIINKQLVESRTPNR